MLGLAVLGALTAAAISGAGTRPTLRVAGPLSLQGRSFHPREVVRVSFTGPDLHRVRRVRVNATGSFRTPIPPHGKCLAGSLLVVAHGDAGDTARLRLLLRGCAPALHPAP